MCRGTELSLLLLLELTNSAMPELEMNSPLSRILNPERRLLCEEGGKLI